MELVQTKSILAKLMATENLHIEQRKVETASFDVKNRILTIPILNKEITSQQYDLFIGHEVGHALYTPIEGLIDANDKNFSMSLLNVLEDSRIERKIKNKFPGLRHSFIKAYRELLDQDFFGTNGKDLNELYFIDKVNLYCKCGTLSGIKFEGFELELVNEIESTQTFEDVCVVYHKVADYIKLEKEIERRNRRFLVEDSEEPSENTEESDSNAEEFSSPEESDTKSKQKGTPISNSEQEKENSNTSNKKSEEGGGSSSGKNKKQPSSEEKVVMDKENDDLVSKTDEAFRKNENRLFSKDNGDIYHYCNIPEMVLDNIIVDHKLLWDKFKHDYGSCNPQLYNLAVEQNKIEYNKFRQDTKNIVSYLVKEFELRKNADQLKRATVSKTGELNMNKLFSYKFSEDIFKKVSVVPNGKSHGLIMYIDWSGSMASHMTATIRQLMSLVMFCKKVNIPYEVYAFATEYFPGQSRHKYNYKKDDKVLDNFQLLNVLSSRMSSTEFVLAAGFLLDRINSKYAIPDWFVLGGTPLNEAVVSAMTIVPEFQKKYNLQVVNTVFLTDGEGSRNLNRISGVSPNDFSANRINISSGKLVIRDNVTKYEVQIPVLSSARTHTSAYTTLLKKRTNSNVVGFYICSMREFSSAFQSIHRDKLLESNVLIDYTEKSKIEFRKNNYKIIEDAGYDEYYLLRVESFDESSEFVVDEDASLRSIASQFTKHNTSRKNNRIILNRFIGMIA